MKPDVRTYEIDGAAVTLTRLPIRRYEWGFREDADGNRIGHPKEGTLFEIMIDGEKVGLASRPNGWGKQGFKIERLDVLGGSWALGDEVIYGKGYMGSKTLYELEQVAAKAVQLRREIHWGDVPRLPTEAQIAKFLAEKQERDAAEKLADAARQVEWAREREENKRKAEERKRRADERRCEILEGLTSMEERLRKELTNFESSALLAAIEDYKQGSSV